MIELTIIILTYNEEKHLSREVSSFNQVTDDVIIIDSFSSDNTVKLAKSLGYRVFQNKWINYAKQLNWGLNNGGINTEWIMRLDADEYLTPELITEIKEKLVQIPDDVDGVFIKRRVYFMGRWIKHGGYYPTKLLRIWRKGNGVCEERWMDEHIKVKGKTIEFNYDLIDENLNNLTWWTEKHNKYATREVADILNIKYEFQVNNDVVPKLFGTQEQRKRWLKNKLYINTPLFVRPFLYFNYRYFIKLGFLDGIQGLIWHFLQGFWYRFLVDAKIYQIEKLCGKNKSKIKEYLKEEYSIEF